MLRGEGANLARLIHRGGAVRVDIVLVMEDLTRTRVSATYVCGDRSLDTVVRAVKWAYNPNHSPNLDASPNH